MPIRLLALDLDGTLLDSRGKLSERNRKAIEKAREQGVRVAIVTGRRFRDARPLALELGIDVPLISHNGALTKHARSLETVNATLLSLEAAREVLRVGREEGIDAMISDDPHGKGVLVYDNISDENHSLPRYIAWSERLHGEEAGDSVRRVDSLEEYLDHEPVHIAFSGTCARMSFMRDRLSEAIGDDIRVLSTEYSRQDFTLLDVLNPKASKGVGVAAAASEYGIARDEVMAIGDNYNDIEMLRFAGTGILMGNADPALRNEGDFLVTADNDADGVAVAIEKFVTTGHEKQKTELRTQNTE